MRESQHDVSLTAENILLCGVLPLWAVSGFADWVCHRQTNIHETAGTHESLTHLLMLGTIGIPGTMALLWEIDESVIAASIAGAVVHELIVLWDTKYASTRRHVSLTEQHIHSFLEVLPWMSTAMLVALHPDRWRALIDKSKRKSFRLRRKQRPLKPQQLKTIFSALTALLAVPYFEELVRCFRVDHTLLPHSKQ